MQYNNSSVIIFNFPLIKGETFPKCGCLYPNWRNFAIAKRITPNFKVLSSQLNNQNNTRFQGFVKITNYILWLSHMCDSEPKSWQILILAYLGKKIIFFCYSSTPTKISKVICFRAHI